MMWWNGYGVFYRPNNTFILFVLERVIHLTTEHVMCIICVYPRIALFISISLSSMSNRFEYRCLGLFYLDKQHNNYFLSLCIPLIWKQKRTKDWIFFEHAIEVYTMNPESPFIRLLFYSISFTELWHTARARESKWSKKLVFCITCKRKRKEKRK